MELPQSFSCSLEGTRAHMHVSVCAHMHAHKSLLIFCAEEDTDEFLIFN